MGFTLKGRDVIKLEAIAKKTGKGYAECFAEIVGRAHDELIGAAAEPKPDGGAEKPATAPPPKASAEGALQHAGEPHDGHALEDSTNEHQDAPDAPPGTNPLAIKRWASVKSQDDEADRERQVEGHRRILRRGQPQR